MVPTIGMLSQILIKRKYREISSNYEIIKAKISALLLEAFSRGLIQLSPASLTSANDNTLKGSWMLALYCLGGEETSLVTSLRPTNEYVSKGFVKLHIILWRWQRFGCAVLCSHCYRAHSSRHVFTPCWLCWVDGWNLFRIEGGLWLRQKRGPPHLGSLWGSAAPKPLSSQLLSYLGKHPLAPSQPRQRKWMRTRATMALHPFRQSLSEQGHGRFVQAGWEGWAKPMLFGLSSVCSV